MKKITTYINERLQLGKKLSKTQQYIYFPKTRKELLQLINDITENHENNDIINLNMIDTSKIDDMSTLFERNTNNYDISEWDVSNVTDMSYMFYKCKNFNSDLSKWDVSNVTNMSGMFYDSGFNGDISQWNVSNVKQWPYIFYLCPLEKNPPKWYE